MPETNIVVSFVSDLIDRAKGLMQQNRASLNVKQQDKKTQEKADEATQGTQRERGMQRKPAPILRPTAVGGEEWSLTQYWTTQQRLDQSTTFGSHQSSNGDGLKYRIGIGSGDGSQWINFEHDMPPYNRFVHNVMDTAAPGTIIRSSPKFNYPIAQSVETTIGSGAQWNGRESAAGIRGWFTLPAGNDAVVAVYRWKVETMTRLYQWPYSPGSPIGTLGQFTYDETNTETGIKCFYVTPTSVTEIAATATLSDALDALYIEQPYQYVRTVAYESFLDPYVEPRYYGAPDAATYPNRGFNHAILQGLGSIWPSISLRPPYELFLTAGAYGVSWESVTWWPISPSVYDVLLGEIDSTDSALINKTSGWHPTWEQVYEDMTLLGVLGTYAIEGLWTQDNIRAAYDGMTAGMPLWRYIRTPARLTGTADGYRNPADEETLGWIPVQRRNFTALSAARLTQPVGAGTSSDGTVSMQVTMATDGGRPGSCRSGLAALGLVLP